MSSIPAKAQAICQAGGVKPMRRGAYEVTSTSGAVYAVQLARDVRGADVCGCEAAKFGQRQCSHVKAAKLWLSAYRRTES